MNGSLCSWRSCGVAALAVVVAAGLALADPLKDAQKKVQDAVKQTKDDATKAVEKAAKDAMPEMSPEQAKMMEAYEKAGTPGEMHKMLAGHAGQWEGVVKFWMAPDAPPSEEKVTCTMEMTMGGRYLYSHWKGEMMGAPFHGVSVQAYNNVTKQFQGTWIDNMVTGIQMMSGTWDAATKTLTWTGERDDPMTGGKVKVRELQKHPDANTMVSEFFDTQPDGKEMKTMEISMKRTAAATTKATEPGK